MEIWKDMKGYEGKYQVSNLGRIKSLERKVNDYKGGRIKKERILKPTDNGHGYLVIRLGAKGKSFYIHRLVAEHFIDNPRNVNYINHLDFDKKNNIFTNLEWCTQRENVLYSNSHYRKPKSKYKISKTGQKYITIDHKRFRVNISSMKIDKGFKTLEEAISYRDAVLKGVM